MLIRAAAVFFAVRFFPPRRPIIRRYSLVASCIVEPPFPVAASYQTHDPASTVNNPPNPKTALLRLFPQIHFCPIRAKTSFRPNPETTKNRFSPIHDPSVFLFYLRQGKARFARSPHPLSLRGSPAARTHSPSIAQFLLTAMVLLSAYDAVPHWP